MMENCPLSKTRVHHQTLSQGDVGGLQWSAVAVVAAVVVLCVTSSSWCSLLAVRFCSKAQFLGLVLVLLLSLCSALVCFSCVWLLLPASLCIFTFTMSDSPVFPPTSSLPRAFSLPGFQFLFFTFLAVVYRTLVYQLFNKSSFYLLVFLCLLIHLWSKPWQVISFLNLKKITPTLCLQIKAYGETVVTTRPASVLLSETRQLCRKLFSPQKHFFTDL